MTTSTESSTAEPAAWTEFGKYLLTRRLAVGGMAEVFVARSTALGGVGKVCVIKRILPEYSNSRQFVSLFIDEARILIGLNHHNIVRLYDFGHVDGSHYMALEYVQGCNLVGVLGTLFDRGEAMHPLAAAYVARETLEGLHNAHIQRDSGGRPLGIVHRDISPHNILISHTGDVKVADFGIAQARNKSTVTAAGTVMGKFAYMAPEQARGEKVDARADVFSVGVTLHEALVGARLFSSGNVAETFSRLLTLEPAAPSKARAGVPEILDGVVLHALKKNRHERFASALEMSQALTEVLARGGGYGPEKFHAYLRSLNLDALKGLRPDGPDAQRPDKGRTVHLYSPAKLPQGDDGKASVELAAAWPEHAQGGKEIDDPELRALMDAFRAEPNLWTLVAMGDHLRQLKQDALAQSAYRVASGAFAYRGLLIQALVALERARDLISERQWHNDVYFLWNLGQADHESLRTYMDRVDLSGLFGLLQDADPDVFGDRADRAQAPPVIPLFGALRAEDLQVLMKRARVTRYAAGTTIVKEGDDGETLYAIGEGRVVVHIQSPHVEQGKIYLSSLSEGDFFGEFGFLTGEKRSASVEAVLDTWVIEVDRPALRSLAALYPQMAQPLMDFYKARVMELLMARNPVFGVLPPEARRQLVQRAELRTFKDNEVIVEQGGEGDAFFFIKSGEVEVYTEMDGVPVFINKLRDGEFFGEIACIKRIQRTASVRAMADVEVLRISREAMEEVVLEVPGLLEKLDTAITSRLREKAAQVKNVEELLK